MENNESHFISNELLDKGNLKDFKSPDDLAKSYLELQKMVGNSVRLPSSPDALPDFYSKIKDVDGILFKNDENLYAKLGRPETPDAYTLEVPEHLIGEELNSFKAVAHEIGLNNDQAAKLVRMRAEQIEKAAELQSQQAEEAEKTLRKLWGDEFDTNLKLANGMAQKYAEKYGRGSVESLLASGAGNNPVFTAMLYELSTAYAEKPHKGSGSDAFGESAESAKAKAESFYKDPEKKAALFDAFHPKHKEYLEELTRLHALAARG